MPFTPYHFGPALLIGVVLLPVVDLSTIIVASVVLDLEPLAVLLYGIFGAPTGTLQHLSSDWL
ncbi:MAG: hypothetical protein ACFFD3_17330 [Candidatus Thorarchaeota archaeon]